MSSLNYYPGGRLLTVSLITFAALLGLVLAGPATLPDQHWLELARQLGNATLGSLGRLTAGLILGVFVGSLIGAAMATWRPLDHLLGPLVHPLRQMPLFGWIALLGLWAGFGEGAKVIFIALAVSYAMFISAYQTVRTIPPRLEEVAQVYQLGWGKRLRVLVLPAVLPGWLGGVRIALSVAWGATIGAEILMGASAAGLGGFIWGQREVGRLDLVLLGTLVIGLFAVLSDIALRRAEQRLRRWLQGH